MPANAEYGPGLPFKVFTSPHTSSTTKKRIREMSRNKGHDFCSGGSWALARIGCWGAKGSFGWARFEFDSYYLYVRQIFLGGPMEFHKLADGRVCGWLSAQVVPLLTGKMSCR